VGGESVNDLGVTLGPGVVDGDAFEAPFRPVANQLAIVSVHQEGVLSPGSRTLARHEVLRHDVGGERGGIVADLDLEIGGGVAGIERADERQDRIEDGLASGYFRKIELELLAGGSEIEDAIFGQRGGERVGVALVETKAIAVESVGDFVTVVGELGEVGGHDLKLDRIHRILQDGRRTCRRPSSQSQLIL
jgi:hypothetical protein